ncbi:phage head closure protein [Noviherbaspirillum sp.]|jgi:SPP1 family predicted phage head-tail adaptor|uniref:phage head closure protein n=1 Tax=Noviherbaspirillum sp. TaxID=1926288 RepID=UPI0025FEC655|nr:phage head closure protein [Noviherbaspirillum sp.]
MRAGKLRHKVTVERVTITQDPDYGSVIETWTPVGTFPASVEPINGREYFTAHLALSEVTTRIRMRYQAGLSVLDRITHGGTVYNVQSVINPDMRNEELVLMCKSTT